MAVEGRLLTRLRVDAKILVVTPEIVVGERYNSIVIYGIELPQRPRSSPDLIPSLPPQSSPAFGRSSRLAKYPSGRRVSRHTHRTWFRIHTILPDRPEPAFGVAFHGYMRSFASTLAIVRLRISSAFA